MQMKQIRQLRLVEGEMSSRCLNKGFKMCLMALSFQFESLLECIGSGFRNLQFTTSVWIPGPPKKVRETLVCCRVRKLVKFEPQGSGLSCYYIYM